MLRRIWTLWPLFAACSGAEVDDVVADSDDEEDVVGPSCTYPAGAVEPMALNEVLSPYSWPRALRADGRDVPLALEKVPCATDPDIDWSPFDVLLFISIPAW
jgi:hypothetical protein